MASVGDSGQPQTFGLPGAPQDGDGKAYDGHGQSTVTAAELPVASFVPSAVHIDPEESPKIADRRVSTRMRNYLLSTGTFHGGDLDARFIVPIRVSDTTYTKEQVLHLQSNYAEYSKVVLAMGGFFFATGMQWSFYIGESASYDRRKEICHHNALCNLASSDDLTWMGLNPDMVWTNASYFVAGFAIMAFSLIYSHRSKSNKGHVETEKAHCYAVEKIVAGGASAAGLLTGEASHTETTGLHNERLSGTYWFVATAIIVEGCLSGLYHTCPSSSFQQFDYIGITTCEITMFLMMWSKFHPKLPTAGTFAMYVAMLGMLAAVETSCTGSITKQKFVWAAFALWIVIYTPLAALTLHFTLERPCSFRELIWVCRRLWTERLVVDKTALFFLATIMLATFVYIVFAAQPQGWHKREDWKAEMLPVLVEMGVMAGCCAIIACLRKKVPYQASEDHFRVKVSRWHLVRIGLLVQWIILGLDHAFQGLRSPEKHNMAQAIMKWHGKGAAMYYLYLWGGLLYFKMFKWKTWRFLRCVSYFVIMASCGLFGGSHFVNASYKPNADIKRYNIPCQDDHVCKKSFNSTLDGDYPCGERDGKWICLIGSLDYNMGCSWVPGVDGHSLWHLYSAVALFLYTVSVMVMDDLLEDTKRDDMAVL